MQKTHRACNRTKTANKPLRFKEERHGGCVLNKKNQEEATITHESIIFLFSNNQ